MAYSPVPIGWPEKIRREELGLWCNRWLIMRFIWAWIINAPVIDSELRTRKLWKKTWNEE